MQSRDEKTKAATEMVKKISEEGVAEINGREYKFTKINFKKRRKVLAYHTSVQADIGNDNYSFLDSPEFEPVEAVINDSVTFNDSLLSRLGDEHWDEYPNDYIPFISVALAVISNTFLEEKDTASALV